MSRSRATVRSRSETADRRKPRNSTRNKPRTICTAGAACGLRIPRKLTLIGLKTMRWVAGTAPVGIGIRITAVTLTFRETESSTARSAGVSIRPSSLALLPLASLATSTTILMTFVILKVGSTAAGSTSAIGGTLAIGGTVVKGGIMKHTTTITAPTMGLTIPATAAWATAVAKAFAVAKAPMVAEAFMVAKAFMAAKAPMVVEAFTVAEAVTVGAGAAIAKT